MSTPRRFDHDEARRLYRAGESKAALARRYGVTWNAIHWALDETARLSAHRRKHVWQRANLRTPCLGGCGELVWTRYAPERTGYCPACTGLRRATSVQDGLLRCSTCHLWKPDDDFPARTAAKARRGRHQVCRGCQAAVRQAYRERRKVPCRRCGQPCLPASETSAERRGQTYSGLCRACWQDTRRKPAVTAEAQPPTEGPGSSG